MTASSTTPSHIVEEAVLHLMECAWRTPLRNGRIPLSIEDTYFVGAHIEEGALTIRLYKPQIAGSHTDGECICPFPAGITIEKLPNGLVIGGIKYTF